MSVHFGASLEYIPRHHLESRAAAFQMKRFVQLCALLRAGSVGLAAVGTSSLFPPREKSRIQGTSVAQRHEACAARGAPALQSEEYEADRTPVLKLFIMSCSDVKGLIPKWLINFVAPKKPGEWVDVPSGSPGAACCQAGNSLTWMCVCVCVRCPPSPLHREECLGSSMRRFGLGWPKAALLWAIGSHLQLRWHVIAYMCSFRRR